MSKQSTKDQPNPSFGYQQHNDEIDLRHLFAILIDGRFIIGGIIVIVAAIALAYIFAATPIYRANGLIQVENNSPGVPGLSEMANIFAAESSSATELHVIKSRLVLGQVVDELGLTVAIKPVYVPILGKLIAKDAIPYQSHSVPFGFSGYAAGGEVVDIAELSVPRYLLEHKLTLVVEGNNQFSLWLKNKKLLQGAVGELVSSENNQIDIRILELFANKGAKFTLVNTSRLTSILNLQKQLIVSEKGKDTGIIEISVEGANPIQISKIVDSVSANYYLQNVQRMAAEAENSLSFLDQQIPRIQQELIRSEEALNDYRRERTSIDLSLEAQAALDRLVQIEAEISTLAINEAEISRRFTAQHPNYISFKRQQSNMVSQREKLSRILEALPDTQKRILRLKRAFEVNQAIFLALQNKRQELAILKASTVGNVRILDKAEVMPNVVAPKKSLILALSLVMGGLLGMLIVGFRHALRSGVSDPKIFNDNGFMVHATIPLSENENTPKKNKKSKKTKSHFSLLAKDHPADLSIEALRSLRTSLHFSMLDSDNQLVMLSSASPGVGKSFISSNLGAVLAQAGQRTLVIDADMRKGYLHKRFCFEPDQGLSEILAGTLDVKQALKSTTIKGLDILTRGKIPTNPSELLMSSQLQSLITNLSSDYDLIIFDTPPILAVTDASIIGTYCGTSLMVARFESCTLKEIITANDRFDLAGVDIKGIVFNAVEKKASSYYYDYGYYNYEYKAED
jgi:tyrosine-protein kinase Etk/Wzc